MNSKCLLVFGLSEFGDLILTAANNGPVSSAYKKITWHLHQVTYNLLSRWGHF